MLGTLVCFGSMGCGLPTWSELIGSKPEETGPVVVVPPTPPPPPPPPPTPPPPPPKPDPETVIAEFRQLAKHEITNEQLGRLLSLEEGLDAIEELDLMGARITSEALHNLHRLNSLRRLDLRGTNLDQGAFAAVGSTTSIRELRIDGHQMTPSAVDQLKGLSELRRLDVYGVQLPPLAWQSLLSSHPLLEDLNLRRSNVPDALMTVVSKLANLKSLDVSECQVTDVGLAQIATLEQLERLVLYRCPITGAGLRGPRGSKPLPALLELIISGTQLNEQGALAIQALKNLKILGIGETPSMLDVHLQQIVKPLKDLEYLDVTRNVQLTSKAFTGLQALKNLREVRFRECNRIDDAALKTLARCENLKRVDLEGTACTVQGVIALKEALPDVEIIGLGSEGSLTPPTIQSAP